MTIVDHLFVFFFIAVQPVFGAITYRRYLAHIEAGHTPDRVALYRQTAIIQWSVFTALMVAWFWLDRPYANLGFVQPAGAGFYVGVALLMGAAGFLAYSWRRSRTMTADERSEQAQSLGRLVHLLPHGSKDLRAFLKLSVTAGIVEEIVYRGFIIWYAALVMPLWAAVIASSIIFGMGHSYQGVGGTAKTGLAGLAFGGLYVLTGSIWLPIIGHAMLDALQGFIIVEILRPKNSVPIDAETQLAGS